MNQKKIAGIRKDKNTEIKKRETPASREAYELNEHLNNIRRCPKSWMSGSRVVRSDLMSVCKEKGART